MVMDKINGVSNLGKGLLERFQGSGRTDSSDPEHPTDVNASGNNRLSASSDTAEISAKAYRLIALRLAVDSGREALDALPEVRQDRVKQARERLNRGYYNSLEVRARVAERLDNVARKLEDL